MAVIEDWDKDWNDFSLPNWRERAAMVEDIGLLGGGEEGGYPPYFFPREHLERERTKGEKREGLTSVFVF